MYARPVALAVCLLLAATLALAGFAKLRDPDPFRRTVGSVLPAAATETVVRMLPVVELALAVLLVSGVANRVVVVVVAALFVGFILALRAVERRAAGPAAHPLARCNCFGASGDGDPRTGQVRNGLLLAAAAALIVWPAEPVWQAGPEDVLGAISVVVGLVCAWSLLVVLVRNRPVGLA